MPSSSSSSYRGAHSNADRPSSSSRRPSATGGSHYYSSSRHAGGGSSSSTAVPGFSSASGQKSGDDDDDDDDDDDEDAAAGGTAAEKRTFRSTNNSCTGNAHQFLYSSPKHSVSHEGNTASDQGLQVIGQPDGPIVYFIGRETRVSADGEGRPNDEEAREEL